MITWVREPVKRLDMRREFALHYRDDKICTECRRLSFSRLVALPHPH